MNDVERYLFENDIANFSSFKLSPFTLDKEKDNHQIIGKVIASNDRDFINYALFYTFCFNEKIKHMDKKELCLMRSDIWDLIQPAKSAIIKYVDNIDKTEYMKHKDTLIKTLNEKLDIERKIIVDTYKIQKSKLHELTSILLDNEYKRLALDEANHLKFGLDLNSPASAIQAIYLREEFIIKAKALYNKEKQEKKYFWISLLLAIASITIGIMSLV